MLDADSQTQEPGFIVNIKITGVTRTVPILVRCACRRRQKMSHPHRPNFSVKQTFAVKILVMFSYKILNIKSNLVGISKQGFEQKQ